MTIEEFCNQHGITMEILSESGPKLRTDGFASSNPFTRYIYTYSIKLLCEGREWTVECQTTERHAIIPITPASVLIGLKSMAHFVETRPYFEDWRVWNESSEDTTQELQQHFSEHHHKTALLRQFLGDAYQTFLAITD